MINEELQGRSLPELFRRTNGNLVKDKTDWELRRKEILDILCKEEYGYSPQAPGRVTGTVINRNEMAYAHKACEEKIEISLDTPEGDFSFPINMIVPYHVERPPVFLLLNFRSNVPDQYFPAEEVLDNGYAVVSVNYTNITLDNRRCLEQNVKEKYFQDKLAAMYPRTGSASWGKIAMWAWAASRIMDYLCGRDDIDRNRIAVIGHSRLGKTALWCAAQDERFSAVMANCSGCAGDSLFRGRQGEMIQDITREFPYWFCENFKSYVGLENEVPFDQHDLLSLIAPRGLCIGAAVEDQWADPVSQFLSAAAASPAWELYGQRGLICEDRLPVAGDFFAEGRVSFHLRQGSHFLSRTDWLNYMQYRKKHQV